MKRHIAFQLIMALVLAGCSIREDRTSCPCTVIVDFSQIDPTRFGETGLIAVNDGTMVLEDIIPAERYSDPYSFRVRRVSTAVDIFSGWPGGHVSGNGFTVSEGEQFPKLYLHSEHIDTGAESVLLTAGLHKSFCKVTICLKSWEGSPYSLSVTGNTCGYDYDGKTVCGAFEYSPAPDGDGICSVRIPRQCDSSLMLRITEDGDVLREFALGEYIEKSGYDWAAEDLEDVEVEIDYAKTDIVFKVNGWQTTISFDVII